MSRTATVPAETDLLCEHCGYTLNGLPDDSRCPECGEPIAPSTSANPRKEFHPRDWFLATTQILFRPTTFFRSLQTRTGGNEARYFAWAFYIVTAMLIQITVWMHLNLFSTTGNWLGIDRVFAWMVPDESKAAMITIAFLFIAVMPIATFFFLDGITRLAAHLSSWEAAYHGLRMPYPAVLRAMYFHAPHYVPATLLVTLTVFGYSRAIKWQWIDATTAEAYLYVLCGEVIVAAIYLFYTYWIAMRNIMYANR